MKKVIMFILVLSLLGCASVKSNTVTVDNDLKETHKETIKETCVGAKVLPTKQENLNVFEKIFKPSVAEASTEMLVGNLPESSTESSKDNLMEGDPTIITVKQHETVKVRTGYAKLDHVRKTRVGESSEVKLTISTSVGSTYPTASTDLSTEGIWRPVLTTQIMRASLRGDGFLITPKSSEEQRVDARLGPTEWIWTVTPQRSGVLHLEAQLCMVLPSRKDLPSLVESVEVESAPLKQAVIVVKSNTSIFVSIITAIGTALGAILTWYFKKKNF